MTGFRPLSGISISKYSRSHPPFFLSSEGCLRVKAFFYPRNKFAKAKNTFNLRFYRMRGKISQFSFILKLHNPICRSCPL